MLKAYKYPAIRLLIYAFLGIGGGFLLDWNVLVLYLFIVLILAISSYLFIKNKYSLSYALISFSIGVLISFNINHQRISYPDKIIGEFPAVFDGVIVKVLKKDSAGFRCIADGILTSKYLPEMRTKLIVTVSSKTKKVPEVISGYSIQGKFYISPPQKKQLLYDFPEEQYFLAMDVMFKARSSLQNISISPCYNFWYSSLDNIRSIVSNRIKSLFSEETAPVVLAILTGDRSSLSYELRNKFALTGTAHILAVSGLHTGIIGGIIFILTSYFKSRRLRLFLFGLLLALFVLFTGMQPSAVRAGALAFAMMLCWYLQRKHEIINLIAFIALMMLVFVPNWLFSIGFQLSFLSFTGIVLFFNIINEFFKKIFKAKSPLTLYLLSAFSVSLSASIVVSVLAAYYFNVFPYISPLINVIAMPAISLSLIYSLIAVMLSFIFFPLGEIFAHSCDVIVNLIYTINDYASSYQGTFIYGESAFLFAFVSSLSSLYIFYSKNIRQVSFRLLSAFLITLMIVFLLTGKKQEIEIFSREKNVVIIAPALDNKTAIIIADRKPKQYPTRDFAMEKYLSSIGDSLLIAYNGNTGICTIENLKGIKYRALHIDNEYQKELSKLLNIPKYLPQMIDY